VHGVQLRRCSQGRNPSFGNDAERIATSQVGPLGSRWQTCGFRWWGRPHVDTAFYRFIPSIEPIAQFYCHFSLTRCGCVLATRCIGSRPGQRSLGPGLHVVDRSNADLPQCKRNQRMLRVGNGWTCPFSLPPHASCLSCIIFLHLV